MLGSLANAMSSIVLSVSVNRILGGESGGIFAFAYAHAQLMLTVGSFEVRQYQSTDVSENYSFGTYWRLRTITCVIMLLATAGYVVLHLKSFSICQSAVILLLTAYKMVEAFSDVYAGRFQQTDRIDISGKTFFARISASTCMFILTVLATRDLIMASGVMVITSVLSFLLVDRGFIKAYGLHREKTDVREVLRLAWDVLPLFFQAFCVMYISNAPKYAINELCSLETQNIYNILFMPTFAINLFSIFVFRPMMLDITNQWKDNRLREFLRTVCAVSGIIILLTLLAVAGCYVLGIPLLMLLYNVELQPYRLCLLFTMGVGGISAFVTFQYYVITAIRFQKWLILGYGVSSLLSVFAARPLVAKYGIWGGIASYAISVFVQALIYFLIFLCAYLKKKHLPKKLKAGEKQNGKETG